jgi:hypothetical protein
VRKRKGIFGLFKTMISVSGKLFRKSRGRPLGSKLDRHKSTIRRRLNGGESQASVAASFGYSQGGLSLWMKRNGLR